MELFPEEQENQIWNFFQKNRRIKYGTFSRRMGESGQIRTPAPASMSRRHVLVWVH